MTDKLGSERIEDAINRLQYDSMIWSAIDYANGYIKHHPMTAKDNDSLTTNRFRIINGLGGTTADLNTVLKLIGLIYYNPTKKHWEPSPVYKDTNICTLISFPDGKAMGWTRKGQLMLQHLLTDLGIAT